MKKFLFLGILFILPLGIRAQEVVLEREQVRRAGSYEVRQLHKGILPYLIFEGKRSITVLPEALFDDPFNQLSYSLEMEAAIWQVEEITYAHFVQGWNVWREAANKYLPQKYQLPELSFHLAEDILIGGTSPKMEEDAFTVHLVSRFPSIWVPHAGSYTSYVDRIELVWPIHLLKYLMFTDTDPFQRALTEGEYRNMICNIVAGPNDYWDNLVLRGTKIEDVHWRNRFRPMKPEEEKCLNILPSLPAQDWVYEGPFAWDTQHTMLHEWGHFFGFGHIDNSIMSTGQKRDGTQVQPTEQDGLRLATLVCWHYNQQAGKEVCVPQVQSVKHEKADLVLQGKS